MRKRGFTYYWQIKNFSFAWQRCILSPDFMVDIMDNTVWRVHLLLEPNDASIFCYLVRRCVENDPATYELEYELEFLDGDGFSLSSKQFSRTSFPKDNSNHNNSIMNPYEFNILKNYVFPPGDTLTVICRMWNIPQYVKEEGRCFAVTRIKIEKKSYTGMVKKFNDLEPNVKKDVRMRWTSGETCFTSVTICFSEDGKICIEITLKDDLRAKVGTCRVILLGCMYKQLECCKNEFETPTEGSPKPLKFWLSRTRNDLVRLFPEGIFYIQCEMEYSTEIDYNAVEKTEYAVNFSEDQAISSRKRMNSVSADDKRLNNFEGRLYHLKDDLWAFHENEILHDIRIKTPTESFPTHSLVLRARSNVIHKHLLNDYGLMITFVRMDLEPDNVRQLLRFLYSDSLDDLDTDSAICLYRVAIKYEIPSLKRRCSLFLLENLEVSNCCDALLLAEKHQDSNMKAMIQDYIHQHDEEIYTSNEWDDFVRSNSLLAAETMSLKYKKK